MRTIQNLFSLLLMFSFSIHAFGQAPTEYPNFLDPDSILVGNKQLPKVLLVGTFHFSYPNLDAHVTEEADQVNILSDKRQKELKDLLAYIAQFKPTKIVVEAGRNTGYLMRKYERWQNGTRPLKAGEVEQIGFRLMEQFNLDTIYGCDALSLRHRMYAEQDTATFRPFVRKLYKDFDWSDPTDPLDAKYDEWYDYDDKLAVKTNLLDYFKYMNSQKVLERSHGAYLIGDFKLDDERGADVLAMYWYSRNLRTFRKIQAIQPTSEDRVLVLFGAGHIPILQHLFQASPEFDLVPFNSLDDTINP